MLNKMRAASLLASMILLTLTVGYYHKPLNYQFKETVNQLQKGELMKFSKPSAEYLATKRILFILHKKVDGRTFRSIGNVAYEGKLHGGLLNCRHPLKIGIPGWQQTMSSKFVSEMTSAYLDSVENVQVVIVRWYAADQNYIAARLSVNETAQTVLKYLVRITQETCLNMRKITLIGHSMGAQVAGATGNLAEGAIGQIVALDPAFPMFYENSSDVVSASSAQRVIGVHSNPGYYGCDWNVGHVDYWANLGTTPQPACLPGRKPSHLQDHAVTRSRNNGDPTLKSTIYLLACSHEQSIHQFFKTVRNPKIYHVKQCRCISSVSCHIIYEGSHRRHYFNEQTKAVGQYCFYAD